MTHGWITFRNPVTRRRRTVARACALGRAAERVRQHPHSREARRALRELCEEAERQRQILYLTGSHSAQRIAIESAVAAAGRSFVWLVVGDAHDGSWTGWAVGPTFQGERP